MKQRAIDKFKNSQAWRQISVELMLVLGLFNVKLGKFKENLRVHFKIYFLVNYKKQNNLKGSSIFLLTRL